MFYERSDVVELVVFCSFFPTPEDDSNPLKCQCADCGLVLVADIALPTSGLLDHEHQRYKTLLKFGVRNRMSIRVLQNPSLGLLFVCRNSSRIIEISG